MQKTRINKQISAPELRLVADDGSQVGIVTLAEAQTMAKEQELDLVEIAPHAKPPVVKLMSYDKFRYQQKKILQQQRKSAKKIEVKTVRISVKIAEGDMLTKAKKIDKFLKDGDLVKLELRMKGREQAFVEVANKQIELFRSKITEQFKIEVPLKRSGNMLSLTISPEK